MENTDLHNFNFASNEFTLYQTHSNFYMVGRDRENRKWKVLKIARLDSSQLKVCEDPFKYTETECSELLQRIDEGNKVTGGLQFVTSCYGLVGFVRFLGPCYMILVTERRKVGTICGHDIYGITSSKIISVEHPSVQSNSANFKDEQRYQKLLHSVDLTKDFFYSDTYNIMWSVQKNALNSREEKMPFESMFVWNEYLTRGIRNSLNNTNWVVALVYGFFKQEKLEVSGRSFVFTLIARRSRHYAGTRFLKRGVNEKGRVANDVETEQIVFEEGFRESIYQISSVVQNRGSIPLYWSQEISILNLKPDIIVQSKDPTYQATRLHFENLRQRYGNPIILLNLIKGFEKKMRESRLSAEYAKAVEVINDTIPEENRLKFLHFDIHKVFRSKSGNVLQQLAELAVNLLDLTGFYYCSTLSNLKLDDGTNRDYSSDAHEIEHYKNGGLMNEKGGNNAKENGGIDLELLERGAQYQSGVLRTNCIDCIDRTNVAQYAYGLVALGRQLHALGLVEVPHIDLEDCLARDLMEVYETMGDTLALQYGGSPAHNKVFCESRGQSRASMNSQEIFRSLRRFYSNVYLDAEKQNSINVFLGHFQPQEGKPALWDLQSDQNCKAKNVESGGSFTRSFSDGNILVERFDTTLPSKKGSSRMNILQEEDDGSSCTPTPTNPRMHPNDFMFSSSLSRESSDAPTILVEDENDPESKDISDGEAKTMNSQDNEDFKDRVLEEKIQSSSNRSDDQRKIQNGNPRRLGEFVFKDEVLPGIESTWKEIYQSSYGKRESMSDTFPDEFSSSFVQWVCHGQTLCH